LGGLIRDKSTEVVNKVPILGDIPILGWLFKSRSASVEKSNLMLFITPRIMRQPEHVRMVLDRKLKERDEFIERAFGGEDTHREVRNRIIRNLPDVKSIKPYSMKKSVSLDEDDDAGKKAAMNDAAAIGGKAPETKDTHETLTLPAADQTKPIEAPKSDPVPVAPPPVDTSPDPFVTVPETGGNP
jgi:Flp pilus assembly secretin CpaC